MKRRVIMAIVVTIVFGIVALLYFQYFSRAEDVPANIVVNTRQITGPLPQNWRALAQGGEERGRMLEGVIPQLTELAPRYIRIDHIYDFYDVVRRDANGNLVYDFTNLDNTVCDILRSGAKPFFALGYMPPALSADGSVIGPPSSFDDWAFLVQKTIERYSGRGTMMCGGAIGHALTNIYYEVWNEPDLEQFGKWSIHGGEKDYRKLYHYAALGASRAQQVNNFALGGPGTTAAYQTWMQKFVSYVIENNLRLDFLSWHHYTTNPQGFTEDMQKINEWIPESTYGRYASLPKIITEWGYDSEPNEIADTNVGAAYTAAAVRNLIDENVFMAFSFEIKDGPNNPTWGILTYEGEKKPRFHTLKLLNMLEGNRLAVTGEGTYVKAIASTTPGKTTLLLVNYDQREVNNELVPVRFANLDPGTYTIVQHTPAEDPLTVDNLSVTGDSLEHTFLMPPNTVYVVELYKR